MKGLLSVRRNVFPVIGLFVLLVTSVTSACSSGSDPASDPASTVASASGSDPQAKVATLETGAARTSSPKPSGKEIRERIDMTEAEKQALQKPYMKCMKQHGTDVLARRGAGQGPDAKSDAANAACESLLPLPAWELDPANPEAREFAQKERDCLKGKGVRYVEISEDGAGVSFGGQDNDAESITLGLKYAPECEREVAAQTR